MKKHLIFSVLLLISIFLMPQAYAPTVTINFSSEKTVEVEYLNTETVADLIKHTRENPQAGIASDNAVWFTFNGMTFIDSQVLRPLNLRNQSNDFILAEVCNRAELASRIDEQSRQ